MPKVKPFRLRPGTRIGNYRVTELLGRGWEGEVYAVREIPSGAGRAVKLFRCRNGPDADRVRHTARLLERLSTTGATARYYHMGHCFIRPNLPALYLVLERLSGVVLGDWLPRKVPDGSFDGAARLRLLRALAGALAGIHAKQVAAGDFESGDNVMILERGKGYGVKFFDFEFGTAKRPNRDYRKDLRQLEELTGQVFSGRKRGNVYGEVGTLFRRHLRMRSSPRVMRSLAAGLADMEGR